MRDIAIYGFGGFGREVACIIQAINGVKPTWNLIGYFDDGKEIGTCNKYGSVLGGMKELNAYSTPLNIVMAIASPSTLKLLLSKVNNSNVSFPTIIAPDALFFDRESVQFGKGNLLGFGVRISCNVTLGNFNLLNGCVSLGHDVKVGEFNVMQPEVRISGETVIGDENFFGVRSTVLQGLRIGNNTRIGVGSVVMRKTKDRMLYFGNPAKLINDDAL